MSSIISTLLSSSKTILYSVYDIILIGQLPVAVCDRFLQFFNTEYTILRRKPQADSANQRDFQTTKLLDDGLPVPEEVITRLRGANKCYATAHHSAHVSPSLYIFASYHFIIIKI